MRETTVGRFRETTLSKRGRSPQRALAILIKRAIDVLFASVGIIVLAPLFAVVAAAVVLDSPGPVFFRHRRAGKNGKPIMVIKFRTMVDGADRIGPEVTVCNDTRITRVGRFLRKAKLDELPQLWNVLKGDMSLVGPRPQCFTMLRHYPREDAEIILSVLPGITGLTQIWLRNEEELLASQPDPIQYYIYSLLPQKIASDKTYVQNWSLMGDASILLRTLKVLFASRARHRPTHAVVSDPQTQSTVPERKVV